MKFHWKDQGLNHFPNWYIVNYLVKVSGLFGQSTQEHLVATNVWAVRNEVYSYIEKVSTLLNFAERLKIALKEKNWANLGTF